MLWLDLILHCLWGCSLIGLAAKPVPSTLWGGGLRTGVWITLWDALVMGGLIIWEGMCSGVLSALILGSDLIGKLKLTFAVLVISVVHRREECHVAWEFCWLPKLFGLHLPKFALGTRKLREMCAGRPQCQKFWKLWWMWNKWCNIYNDAVQGQCRNPLPHGVPMTSK